MYTTFWQEISDEFLIGEAERVPLVRHDLFEHEWNVVGQIVVKGFHDVGYFPTVLSVAFVIYCLFGKVDEQTMLESFLSYLSPVEKEIIENAMASDANEKTFSSNELLELLEQFKCRSRVVKSNISSIVHEIAQQELLQKPHIMASEWSKEFTSLQRYDDFKSVESVKLLYSKSKATSTKVIGILSYECKDDGERDSIGFLKRYIRGLDVNQLKRFLKFVTGSDLLHTVSEIKIAFTYYVDSEFSRRPIAHTCGPLLELPSTYRSFCELRSDFSNILKSNDWQMDII